MYLLALLSYSSPSSPAATTTRDNPIGTRDAGRNKAAPGGRAVLDRRNALSRRGCYTASRHRAPAKFSAGVVEALLDVGASLDVDCDRAACCEWRVHVVSSRTTRLADVVDGFSENAGGKQDRHNGRNDFLLAPA